MTTRANRVLDCDVCARVDSHAIILVINIRTRNDNIGTITNIESVRIHTERITRNIVDGHVRDRETIGAINRDSLNRRVVDVQIRNGRVGKVVCIKEFGLGHAARAALAVPVVLTIAVEDGARGTFDGDAVAFDLEQGAIPLGVFPGGLALKNDLRIKYEISPPYVMFFEMYKTEEFSGFHLPWCRLQDWRGPASPQRGQ